MGVLEYAITVWIVPIYFSHICITLPDLRFSLPSDVTTGLDIVFGRSLYSRLHPQVPGPYAVGRNNIYKKGRWVIVIVFV